MMMGERIINLLMKRDGVSREEAVLMYENTKSEIQDAVYGTGCLDPEDILADELGLEPDYLFDFL